METTTSLSAEQVQSFEDKGFLHVKNVLSPQELEQLRADEERITRPAMRHRLCSPDYFYATDPQTGKIGLQRINSMYYRADSFLRLLGNPNLLRIAEAIQGRDALPGGLALVIKSPGYGASVAWHRDPAYCSIRHGINMGIYLDDADAGNGMLYIVPGSHKRSDLDIQALIEEHGFLIPGAIPVQTKAGDVVVHSENVYHGSRVVRSEKQRRVLYYGCRTVEEQMARGLTVPCIQAAAKIIAQAVKARAASDLGRSETPWTWKPTSAEWLPDFSESDYVEMRLMEGYA